MPCLDGGPSNYTTIDNEDYRTLKNIEATLCGIFTSLGGDLHSPAMKRLFNSIDWKEAGVEPASIRAWWKRHQRRDKERRAREAAKRKIDKQANSFLRKLSTQDVDILREALSGDQDSYVRHAMEKRLKPARKKEKR